ncbi:hypothetical protein DPMN_176909 [Dreissena polymorpha]|uniref:Uncharacterized protein n=1 Tax=Dreissena polymorpha TaxID=45954 RepID=A0A9D4IHC3_DREPO|nr:hypothetical protein DPMN_176909 [Dreissena polymorpha]
MHVIKSLVLRTQLELGVLEAAWLKGMTSTRKECQPKILEVATQLETTSERIQFEHGSWQFEHVPCRVNNQFFKETSEAWRNLDEHTKKQLTEEAEKIRHKPHEKADIKEVVKQQMRIISDAV